jgi:hypothetical protein
VGRKTSSSRAYCAKDIKAIGELVQSVVLILEVCEPEEMAG